MGPMMSNEPSHGLAVASLIIGILAIPGACCCYSSVPLGIAAIVMGFIAMNKAKESPATHGGRGLAVAGLSCGVAALVFTVLAIILGMSTQLLQRL
jgi:hypothetical protein